MRVFSSDGVDIAFEVTGDGDPIVLVHGFASNAQVNWVDPGWVGLLADDGRQVITVDNRGHGASAKLYDPADYGAPTMAEDVARLLDHLGHARADVMGYSMGARVCAFLAINHPRKVRSAVLAGLAANMIHGVGGAEPIAEALEAPSRDLVTEPGPRAFRLFAEATRSDLKALAACMRSSRQKISEAELGTIAAPVLVAVGTEDDIAGPPEPLVAAIPEAEALPIPGRDHMRAVGDKVYKAGVINFLSQRA